MKRLNAQDALQLLERAVATRGEDFTFPSPSVSPEWWNRGGGTEAWSCRYFLKDGAPACIIGLALSYEGVTAEDMRPFEELNASILDKVDGVSLTSGAREVFRCAQSAQDEGRRWGSALEGARRRASVVWTT